MKSTFIGFIFASALTFVGWGEASAQPPSLSEPAAESPNAHIVNTFAFDIAAPIARVAPLFAPEAERSWAGSHWNPVFAYPQPGRDITGAVFTVKHGPYNSVWVNTVFDVAAGQMQYVAVFGDKFAMTVDVKVTALASDRTRVKVKYVRTALDPQANEDVQTLGESDRGSGPDWQRGIEAVLGLGQKVKRKSRTE